MIEEKDLRMGNSVLVNGVPTIVESIHHDGINEVDDSEYGEYSIISEDIIEPIPLTEEWLIKFGFESNPYIDTYELYELDELKFILDIDKTRGKLDIHWKQVECKYVHSLQNLFHSLTGEELTIK